MAYGALPRNFSPHLAYPVRSTRSSWRTQRGTAIVLIAALCFLYYFNPLGLKHTTIVPRSRHHITDEEVRQARLQKLEASGGDPLVDIESKPDPLAPGPVFGAPSTADSSSSDQREHWHGKSAAEEEADKKLLESGIGPDEWEAIQQEQDSKRREEEERKRKKKEKDEEFKRTRLEEERAKKDKERKAKEDAKKVEAAAEAQEKKAETQRKQAEAVGTFKDRDQRPKTPSADTTSPRPDIKLDHAASGLHRHPDNHNTSITSTLVVGHRSEEALATLWIHADVTTITHKRIYVVDDLHAEHHLKQNKGREAMVYLRYILDYYDDLDDVTLFFHAGRAAWHNSVLFNHDAAIMVNNLNRSYVLEKGYVNARCEAYPGCTGGESDPSAKPDDPGWIKFDVSKLESQVHWTRNADLFTTELWDQLFPNRTSDPKYLSQPCCSQFAASRDTIRAVPKTTYKRIHDWLGTTTQFDVYTGRVMEYVWQYLFLDVNTLCPDMRTCYCSAYGLCLNDTAAALLEEYNNLNIEIDDTLTKIEALDNFHRCREDFDELTQSEQRQKCLQDNKWLEPLGKMRDKVNKLMRELPKQYGIMKVGGAVGDGIGKASTVG